MPTLSPNTAATRSATWNVLLSPKLVVATNCNLRRNVEQEMLTWCCWVLRHQPVVTPCKIQSTKHTTQTQCRRWITVRGLCPGAIDSSRTDDISAFVCQERVVGEELCRAEFLQRCVLDDAGRREEHLFDPVYIIVLRHCPVRTQACLGNSSHVLSIKRS